VLKLHPNCECCDVDLPPDSTEANICTYECTFCTQCVEDILHNVCPNCGGGFVPRPIRPKTEYRKGVSVTNQPPSTNRIFTSYSREELEVFCSSIKGITPEKR